MAMATKKPMRSRVEAIAGVCGLIVAAGAGAQGTGAPGGALQARISTSLYVSDNLASLAATQDRGALLTITPGVRLAVRQPELDAAVDYGLNLLVPWRISDAPPDRVTHQLDARGRWHVDSAGVELIGQAGIRQQSLSAFGPQASLGIEQSARPLNQNEVYSVSIAPRWVLRLGAGSEFRVDHRTAASNTKGSVIGDVVAQESGLSIGSRDGVRLGWQARVSTVAQRPKAGPSSQTDRAILTAVWRPDTDWLLTSYAGRERSDLRRLGFESGPTYGLSATWSPSPRTMLRAAAEERVIGRTHSLVLSQRFRRATLSVSQTRGVSEPGVLGAVGSRTHYDLLFAQLALEEPDPVRRDLLVRQRLEQLGLNPNAQANNGLLSSRPTLTRQRVLAGTWVTPRSSWTLSATDSLNTRFAPTVDVLDDFALSSQVRLRGLSVASTYRFSPTNSVGANLQWQRNEGDRASLATELRAATVTWSARLGARQQVNAMFRHAEFDSATRPYNENALMLSYLVQF